MPERQKLISHEKKPDIEIINLKPEYQPFPPSLVKCNKKHGSKNYKNYTSKSNTARSEKHGDFAHFFY
jgi:hypothetical protein